MTEPHAQALAQNEACLEKDLAGLAGRPVDAVVIGSGYGGSVAALRLAAARSEVVVLERGEEWHSGEFPDGLGKAFGQVRMRMPGSPDIQGNPQGLFEMRAGDGLAALVGNALGGTSQINANLLRKPDADTFQRYYKTDNGNQVSLWPALLREPGALDDYYDRARDMLGAQPLRGVFQGSRPNGEKLELNEWGSR
ncbi:FAD-binding protein [Ottowia sp. VDI28]|uniref:FAD-binding protein n=1 Tax=Ottowia sp. VDI28 TaxID=3133968 RepID=UPI003C3024DC